MTFISFQFVKVFVYWFELLVVVQIRYLPVRSILLYSNGFQDFLFRFDFFHQCYYGAIHNFLCIYSTWVLLSWKLTSIFIKF